MSFRHIHRLSYLPELGTDSASPLNFHSEAMWREMSALVDLGMSPIQVISVATQTG